MDSNYLKRYLFSFEGRVTRLEYWMFYVPLIIGYIIVFIFAAVFGEEAATIILYLLGLVYIWSVIAIQVKRWHDRDKSGWWILINFIPIIGIWALIENGFLRGTEGKNRFGEDPLERSTSNKEEITASKEATSEITDGDKKENSTSVEETSKKTSSDKEEIASSEEVISDNEKDSPEDKLTKLSELKEKGLIDEDDYNSKKEEILETI